uniref:Uncharacterized protein n=1 Tax=Arundo donax TaxID=35708 RepID=A0A0A9C6C1_ARUDO
MGRRARRHHLPQGTRADLVSQPPEPQPRAMRSLPFLLSIDFPWRSLAG